MPKSLEIYCTFLKKNLSASGGLRLWSQSPLLESAPGPTPVQRLLLYNLAPNIQNQNGSTSVIVLPGPLLISYLSASSVARDMLHLSIIWDFFWSMCNSNTILKHCVVLLCNRRIIYNKWVVINRQRGRCAYMTHQTLTDVRRVQTPAAKCRVRRQSCHLHRTADDWGTNEVARRTRLLWTRVEWMVERRATAFNNRCHADIFS